MDNTSIYKINQKKDKKSDKPEDQQSGQVVSLTVCETATRSLQSPKDQLELQYTVVFQRLPLHFGLLRNEIADTLAKADSRLTQEEWPTNLKESKALIKLDIL